jgi:hypothetical protein
MHQIQQSHDMLERNPAIATNNDGLPLRIVGDGLPNHILNITNGEAFALSHISSIFAD